MKKNHNISKHIEDFLNQAVLFYESTMMPRAQEVYKACITYLQKWYTDIKSFYHKKIKPACTRAYDISSEWLRERTQQAESYCKTTLLPKYRETQKRTMEQLRTHSKQTVQFVRENVIPDCCKTYQKLSASLKQTARNAQAHCTEAPPQPDSSPYRKQQTTAHHPPQATAKPLQQNKNTHGKHMNKWKFIIIGIVIGVIACRIFSGSGEKSPSSGTEYPYTPNVTATNRLAAKAALWPFARDILASEISKKAGVPVSLSPCSNDDNYWMIIVGSNAAAGYVNCRIHYNRLVEIVALVINALDNNRDIPGAMIWDYIRNGM